MKAGEQAASDVEGDVTAVLMALYAGAHATLPTDATAQLPPRGITERVRSSRCYYVILQNHTGSHL
jgi:hypothetical protein